MGAHATSGAPIPLHTVANLIFVFPCRFGMNSCRRLLSQGVANFLQRSPHARWRGLKSLFRFLLHFIRAFGLRLLYDGNR